MDILHCSLANDTRAKQDNHDKGRSKDRWRENVQVLDYSYEVVSKWNDCFTQCEAAFDWSIDWIWPVFLGTILCCSRHDWPSHAWSFYHLHYQLSVTDIHQEKFTARSSLKKDKGRSRTLPSYEKWPQDVKVLRQIIWRFKRNDIVGLLINV